MIPANIAGALALGIPLLLVAWIALRRHRAVFLFSVALIVVGLGYLSATGATTDIGRTVLGFARDLSLRGDKSGAPAGPAPSEYPSK